MYVYMYITINYFVLIITNKILNNKKKVMKDKSNLLSGLNNQHLSGLTTTIDNRKYSYK